MQNNNKTKQNLYCKKANFTYTENKSILKPDENSYSSNNNKISK